MRYLAQFCIAFLACSHAARIDDFQNLAVGRSWKYAVVNSGNGDVGWGSESTVAEISVPSGTISPDSATFQILVTMTNIFYRRGNYFPQLDTTVDTTYPPYTNQHQCTKILATGRVSCRDWRGVVTNSMQELFTYGFGDPRPLQFGIADYNFRNLDNAVFNGDTLGFFRYDSGQGYAPGCFTGQIPTCRRVGFNFLDSVGFVGSTREHFNYLGSGTYTINLVEFNSRPFSYTLIPTSIHLAPRFTRPNLGFSAAYDAVGRKSHEPQSRRTADGFLKPGLSR